MNIDTFEKLQLNEVKELIKNYCVKELIKNYCVNVTTKYELLIITTYQYL